MDAIEALLAHAIVDPAAAGDRPEARAAKALGLQILGLVGERPLTRTLRARTPEGKQVGLVVVADTAVDAERDQFAAAADRLHAAGAIPGAVGVHAIAPSRDAFVVDLWTTGCATDLPTLHWAPRRRLEFVRRAILALDSLHRAGVVHGCLCADNVLLDDDLQPVLAEAGLVSVHALLANQGDASGYATFAAPEVKAGGQPDVRSDVWSAGCLLDLLVGERDLPQVAEIVRRCVASSPHVRFGSATELAAAIEAVIVTLPTGERISRVGMSPGPASERGPRARPQPGRGIAPTSKPVRSVRLPALAGIVVVVAALAGFAFGPEAALARGLFALMAVVGVGVATWFVRSDRSKSTGARGAPAHRETRKDGARRSPP